LTEIPDHLLARSKARRQAIGAEGDDTAAEPQAAGSAVEPAAAAAPAAPAGPAGTSTPVPARAPVAEPPPPPKPPRPEVAAALGRRKIPWWAVPAVAALPVWAAMYAFTLEPPTTESLVLSEGARLYSAGGAGCAGCHGATGGGGVGPAMSGGAVVETFSSYEDHIQWVALGSQGWQAEVGPTYGDTAKPVGGSGNLMPAFSESLTEEEIALVVRYEREVLSEEECIPELAELSGEACPE